MGFAPIPTVARDGNSPWDFWLTIHGNLLILRSLESLAKGRDPSVGRCLKHEIERPRFAPGDADILLLRPIGLMPGCNRVFAWWKLR
jgi:hypothetical protein